MRGIDHYSLQLAVECIFRALRQPDPGPSLREAVRHITDVAEGRIRTASPGPSVEVDATP